MLRRLYDRHTSLIRTRRINDGHAIGINRSEQTIDSLARPLPSCRP